MEKEFEVVRRLMDQSFLEFDRPGFIPNDPISVPHRFSKKEDIEIAGFFAAAFAWGNRKTIITNTNRLLEWMDDTPFEFILGFKEKDLRRFVHFVHRTFNGDDCIYFLHALKRLYTHHGGLEGALRVDGQAPSVKEALVRFRTLFFEKPHLPRTEKHVANPARNSSAKRLNMFLRWMVRQDARGVDFGIWNSILPEQLMCPLDIHTGTVARKLGLLKRRQDDWKAVEELTASLRVLDPMDPVKYDLALFSLGVHRRV